ncbi:RidA family protein [Bradyrhizobium sp. Ghvi]|uniref:RidA family protein n=1 Tax=Bradyrhizobium sp. Ghvi TaxID=1855319 RepID=UPI000B812275|nr:RidA family protein [Bradyrhizobium sp. Ghvi]
MTDLKRTITEIPPARRASALYQPWVISGTQLFVSGQVSDHPMVSVRGIVGEDLSTEQGVMAARLCGLNLIAQITDAVAGDLSLVKKILRVTGYVRCAREFTDIPKIVNGCSEALIEVLGPEVGGHARTSVGVFALPRLFAVECDAIVELNGIVDRTR